MARALQLARAGMYSTSPNPRVGCVLVKNDHIIGEGWHQKAGEAHAEINALAAAGTDAHGATAYVTLEPCSHHGKTPPCAHALVEAGIARVVYALQDPNPEVAGKGIAYLKAAGIAVSGPILEEEAAELNIGFNQRMRVGKPWVFAKIASSIDGRTAMQSGESQWITGAAARADVQKLRARSCAIVTGIGTVLQDNPALTVRDEHLQVAGLPLRQPLRVIVDSHLQTPITAKILHEPGHCLLAYANGETPAAKSKIAALLQQGVELIKLPNANGKVNLQALILELAARQCNEIMVESGASLQGALLREQLLDELYIYMAPVMLGSNARPLAMLPFDNMSQQLRLQIKEIRQIGDDIRWQVKPLYQ